MSVTQLAKFAEERVAAAGGDEPDGSAGGGGGFVGGGGGGGGGGGAGAGGDDPEGHALLWGLLHTMCKHRGSLTSSSVGLYKFANPVDPLA
jgi:hypothetical protein